MRVGRMRSVISIEVDAGEVNRLGERGEKWSPLYKNIRAKKTRTKGGEQSASSGDFMQVVWVFNFRYQSGIHTECRIIQDDQVFNIIDVDNIGDRNREIKVYCIEQSRSGITGF